MKKLFNLRFIFVYFLLVVLGITVSRVVSCYSSLDTVILIVLVFASVNLLVFSLVCARKYAKLLLNITVSFVIFIMAITSGLILASSLNKDFESLSNDNYAISGEIQKVNYQDGVVYLKDVVIDKLDYKMRGEVKIYWYDETVSDKIVRGDKLSLSCYLVLRDGNDRFVGSSQTAVGYVSDKGSVEITESKSLKDKFKRSVWDKLCSVNDNKSVSEIEFAMLFGDKDHMSDDTQSVYSVTGLAHILAVSGLHVGFVVSIIYTLVKRILKYRHWLTLLVTSIFIVAYLYLCDFAISAVRAVLMTIVIYYAKARGKQYDALCGLSLAGILILVASPFDLFDVGFQLSFSVVFSLFALSPPIGGWLKKFMPEKLANALSVCLATFIGSILIIAYYFNNCSTLAILSNLIIIPVVSIAFTMLFLTVILSTIFPFLKFLIAIPSVLFECINVVVYSISELKISALLFSTNIIGVLLGFVVVFILSDYVFLTKKQKAVVVGVLVCFIGMTVVHSNYRILEEMSEVLV